MSGIKEGYDMPMDLTHESRNWWGLTTTQFIMMLLGSGLVYGWYRLCQASGLGLYSQIFQHGAIVLITVSIAAIVLRLDRWIVRVVRWRLQPYQIAHDDKKLSNLSGIIDINGGHFLSTSGKLCAILQLTAIGNNRIDPEYHDAVLSFDRDFLNALPCPIQIIGRSSNYDIASYIELRLKGANNLSSTAQELMVDNLNFYAQYVNKNEVRNRDEYMVIGVDSDRAHPIEELDTYVDIITTNLATSGVIGRRLFSTEIATMAIELCTGIGKKSIDYLSMDMEVNRE